LAKAESVLTQIRWSLAMHWVLAITNACNAIKYVTRFSCDIFGFYVAFIYLQKGIQVLTRQGSGPDFYLSIVVSILVLAVGYICGIIGSGPLFQHYVRVFIKDYGTPLTVVFFTGFVHIGKMADIKLSVLPTSKAFFPTTDRGWFIDFWNIRISDIFIAIPFAILLTILFYFDHNGIPLLHSTPVRDVLTRSSVIPHSPRHRVPTPQTRRFPLGYLPPRSDNRHCRPPRNPLPQRSHPPSPISHRLSLRHKGRRRPERRRRKQRSCYDESRPRRRAARLKSRPRSPNSRNHVGSPPHRPAFDSARRPSGLVFRHGRPSPRRQRNNTEAPLPLQRSRSDPCFRASKTHIPPPSNLGICWYPAPRFRRYIRHHADHRRGWVPDYYSIAGASADLGASKVV